MIDELFLKRYKNTTKTHNQKSNTNKKITIIQKCSYFLKSVPHKYKGTLHSEIFGEWFCCVLRKSNMFHIKSFILIWGYGNGSATYDVWKWIVLSKSLMP